MKIPKSPLSRLLLRRANVVKFVFLSKFSDAASKQIIQSCLHGGARSFHAFLPFPLFIFPVKSHEDAKVSSFVSFCTQFTNSRSFSIFEWVGGTHHSVQEDQQSRPESNTCYFKSFGKPQNGRSSMKIATKMGGNDPQSNNNQQNANFSDPQAK